jgi:hypothetical protein
MTRAVTRAHIFSPPSKHSGGTHMEKSLKKHISADFGRRVSFYRGSNNG